MAGQGLAGWHASEAPFAPSVWRREGDAIVADTGQANRGRLVQGDGTWAAYEFKVQATIQKGFIGPQLVFGISDDGASSHFLTYLAGWKTMVIVRRNEETHEDVKLDVVDFVMDPGRGVRHRPQGPGSLGDELRRRRSRQPVDAGGGAARRRRPGCLGGTTTPSSGSATRRSGTTTSDSGNAQGPLEMPVDSPARQLPARSRPRPVRARGGARGRARGDGDARAAWGRALPGRPHRPGFRGPRRRGRGHRPRRHRAHARGQHRQDLLRSPDHAAGRGRRALPRRPGLEMAGRRGLVREGSPTRRRSRSATCCPIPRESATTRARSATG